jgi:chromosome segregation ATPase
MKEKMNEELREVKSKLDAARKRPKQMRGKLKEICVKNLKDIECSISRATLTCDQLNHSSSFFDTRSVPET